MSSCWLVTFKLFFYKYLLPNTGVDKFSALDTIDGIPVRAQIMASKKLEWGAATKIGASGRLATFPFTLTWNPITKYAVRVRLERAVWIILLGNRNTKTSSSLQSGFIFYFKRKAPNRFPSSNQHWGPTQGSSTTHQENVGLKGKSGRGHHLVLMKDKAMYTTLWNPPPRYSISHAIFYGIVP